MVTDTIFGDHFELYEKDSVYTDWFQIGLMSEFSYKMRSTNLPKQMLFGLEKRSDSSISILPSLTGANEISAHAFTLINGGNEDYRVILVNLDTLAEYKEEMYLGGLIPQDTLNFKKAESRDIIDLNAQTFKNNGNERIEIQCNPNPTNDKLFVSGLLPEEFFLNEKREINEKIEFSIYDLQGNNVFQFSQNAGDVYELDVSTYIRGTYLIQASQQEIGHYVTGTSIQAFVVSD
jgi:hypothetical protein